MPQLFTDPDATISERFGETVVDQVSEVRHATTDAPMVRPAVKSRARKLAKGQVWSAIDNVRGVLHRPMSTEDISRFSGLQPEFVAVALMEMERAGEVRRCGDLWERVIG